MTTRVTTLHEGADLEIAEGLMAVLHIRHLPVVHDGRLVGLVTHRDLLALSLSPFDGHSADAHEHLQTTVRVGRVMRRDVATVAPDTDLRDALRVMRNQRFGCLPVVEAGDRLVGIVTEADFMHLAQLVLGRVESLAPGAMDAVRREAILDQPSDVHLLDE
ncbi:MAG: CBS domain-containing protein [Myxococcales bacterium]|nr:CBS domain-containing protein [Myxococcales bacterium]